MSTRRGDAEAEQERLEQFLAWRRAHKLIGDHRDVLQEIADELLAHEVLERETIVRIMERHGEGGETLAQLPTGAESPIAAAERLEP